jgi:predicted ester cyclase
MRAVAFFRGRGNLERRDLLAAALVGCFAGPVLAQPTGAMGKERIGALGAVPLNQDPSIHAVPSVKELLERTGPEGDLARHWLRFLQGISGRRGLTVDDVVTPDVRCIELQLAGLPGDLATLRQFRDSMNGSLDDNFIILEEMLVEPAQQVVEVKLHGGGKHVGPIMGLAPTGRVLAYDVRTLNLFRDGKMALRWDRTNLVAQLQQLTRG